jgi:asparagine synthase (glutamine-hydrolysing)
MCGFVGCWRDAAIDVVAPLARTLKHRGPDGEGVYVAPDRSVAFAHRRLAIVDLATGDQPMANEDRTVWIAFNGEIYNHLELRQQLERAGHRYRTTSDTETLIHAYEEWGDDFVARLNGEFAFVVYDERRRHCLLARDRLGIRPLFYATIGSRLFFASEIKALAGAPGFSPALDPTALDQYLSLRYSFGEQTMLRGVRRLPPGTTLRLDEEPLRPRRYWEAPIEPRRWSEEDAADRLDELLRESVRMRLMSDVPVGMYLSGGVDSGLILALLARDAPQAIRTFSIGFDLPLDERRAAGALAQEFGAKHTEVVLDRGAFTALPEIVRGLDEPLGDAIVVPTYFLAKTAARDVKVVLTGEGADEIFGSYVHQHSLARYGGYRQRLPKPLIALAPAIVDRLPLPVLDRLFPYPDSLGSSGRARLSQFLRRAETGHGYLSLVQLFDRGEKRSLVAGDWQIDPGWEDLYDTSNWQLGDYLNRAIQLDLRFWLPDYTLFKQDRLTMAHSVEGRVPYLDHRIVEFAGSLPTNLKARAGSLKHLLRMVASRYLNRERATTPKAAFYLPIRKFLGADFDEFVRDTLDPTSIRRDGYLNPAAVNQVVNDGLGHELLAGKRLMAVLIFTLWSRSLSRLAETHNVPISSVPQHAG